ncbi:MAG TPA: AMP-binding protein, partial [Pseudonocardia sp.]|nr:AMP-binding protein [Pseudonocardia sp.]
MPPDVIRKPEQVRRSANLVDYEHSCRDFSWERARRELSGLPGGAGLNIAHEAVDRHAGHPARADAAALRWLGRGDRVRDVTYRELAELTSRFANVLTGLGVGPGERVFTLLGRVPELYVAVLGTLKARAVASPLFSAFGPEPVRERLNLGEGAVLVTTPELYRRTVAGVRDRLPALRHVLLTAPASGDGAGSGGGPIPGTCDLAAMMAAASPVYTIAPTDPEDVALLHFTSGTTGRPKGALHVHEAVVAHLATAREALDLRADDLFWCTADPGWVTGTSYGVIGPLSVGATSIVDEAELEAERWYGILAHQCVT